MLPLLLIIAAWIAVSVFVVALARASAAGDGIVLVDEVAPVSGASRPRPSCDHCGHTRRRVTGRTAGRAGARSARVAARASR